MLVKQNLCFFISADVPELNLSLNNINIESVSHFTFLSIILDTVLSWKYHINMIAIKISKVIGILHKLKYTFPKDILLTIYKSLILPHLNYGLLFNGGTPARHFCAPENSHTSCDK